MPAIEKYGDAVLATKGLMERQSASFIKMSGRRHNDALKGQPSTSQ